MRKTTMKLLMISLLLWSLVGCGNKTENAASAAQTTSQETEIQKEASAESEESVAASELEQQERGGTEQEAPQAQEEECSLCEIDKVCGDYTAEGKEYIVCPDCANEFITAFSDTADKQVCTGCEQEKICGVYTVDGQEYVVCLDDFQEFATGVLWWN